MNFILCFNLFNAHLRTWLRDECMQVIPSICVVKSGIVSVKVSSCGLLISLCVWWLTHDVFLPAMFTSRCCCNMMLQGQVRSHLFVTIFASRRIGARSHSYGKVSLFFFYLFLDLQIQISRSVGHSHLQFHLIKVYMHVFMANRCDF